MLVAKYDAFVFDWDGTVMDTTEPIAQGLCYAFEKLGYTVPTMEKARSVIGLAWEPAILTLVPEFKMTDYPLFEKTYREYYFAKERDVQVFAGLETLMRNMHAAGLKLAVATGKSRAGLNRVFAQTGLEEIFDVTVTADESRAKPDPLMLQIIAKRLNVDIEQMVMIGDTEHDLWMAKNAGCGAVAVSYGAFPKTELKKWHVPVVDNTVQLAGALGVEEFLG